MMKNKGVSESNRIIKGHVNDGVFKKAGARPQGTITPPTGGTGETSGTKNSGGVVVDSQN